MINVVDKQWKRKMGVKKVAIKRLTREKGWVVGDRSIL